MSYDLYVGLQSHAKEDVDSLVKGRSGDLQVFDIATRIKLLAGVAAQNESLKDYVIGGARKQGGGYRSVIHDPRDPKTAPCP